jgi:hypothetical protein
MRTKLITTLGYTLLGAVAVVMALSWETSINFSEVVQLAVFAAGATSLFLMTQTRSHK